MIKKTFRIIKTGFCFLIFGIGSLTLATTILPLITIFSNSTDKKNSRTRLAIHYSWQFFVAVMSAYDLISVKIKNPEKLKNLRGHIIVANHPSLIDIVILISLIPNADCIVKGSLLKNFFMKRIVRSLYIINTLDFDKLLSRCDSSLKKGNNLIIFPEGTRTVPGQKSQISRGAARIALHCNSNILPIKIECEPRGLLKNQKWYEARKKLRFELEIKTTIEISQFQTKKGDESLAARHLTNRIKEEIF